MRIVRHTRSPSPAPTLAVIGLGWLACVCPPLSAACRFDVVDQAMSNLLAADGLNDGAVLIGSAQGVLHRAYFGSYDATTVVPLASGSKLLAGVRIVQLAEHGVVSLDTPVSDYLSGPDFPWSSDAATITLRQMFSHTAGYGDDESDPLLELPSLTLQTSVELIASNWNDYSPQNFLPAGTQFAYGGVAMQIGGYVAQVQSSVDWQAGWQQDLGAPMCIGTIDWQGLGTTTNYHIGGGAEASLDDYARVLAMLLDDGVGNGVRLLDSDAVATLDHSQTGNATAGFVPAAEGNNTHYGVGAWIEDDSVSTDQPTISSIGKFGFAPWVDFSSGTYGILMVDDETGGSSNPASVNSHLAMVAAIAAVREQMRENGTCPAIEIADPIFRDGLETALPAPRCAGDASAPRR